MKWFAKTDDNGLVSEVVVADSMDWVVGNIGGTWVETFKDGTRFNYASIGYTYDADRDAFIPPTPYPSWVLDEDTCLWVAPVPLPDDADTVDYVWDESSTNWVEVA